MQPIFMMRGEVITEQAAKELLDKCATRLGYPPDCYQLNWEAIGWSESARSHISKVTENELHIVVDI